MNRTLDRAAVRLPLMALAALVVVAWPWLAPRLGCLATAAVIAPLWLLIAAAGIEAAALRRRALLAFYLAPHGLGRLLRPGLLLALVHGLGGGLFALLLLLASPGLNDGQRWLLVTDLLLLLLLEGGLARLLGGQLRADVRGPLLRLWAHRVNALLLWPGLLLLGLLQPATELAGMPLDRALQAMAGQVHTGCDAVAVLERLQAMASVLPRWAAANLAAGNDAASRSLLAWLLLVLSVGVSLLFAWAYSRLLSGSGARPWRQMGGDTA